MIVVCGILSEPPIAMVVNALEQLGLRYCMLHQRKFLETSLDIQLEGPRVNGRIVAGGAEIACADVTGIYARLMDWHIFPEAAGDDPVARSCRRWHDVVSNWIEIAPVHVMNRGSAMASNQSKPYQMQLIRKAGLRVPETLITNDPDLVQSFRSRHGDVIFKSISGVRSIVRRLDEQAAQRLPLVRACPVQFQRYIAGTNIRVHVVGREVFATRIETDRVDYRYAHRDGGYANLTSFILSDDVAEKCVNLTASLGLSLAGIDLLLADDGEVYCFEVNPSPAFSYFENNTGQPIARAIAMGLADPPYGGF